jgi:hypothetical protein
MTPVTSAGDLVDRWKLGGYAPGSYMCICVSCGNAHEADKRAVQCVHCAAREAAARILELEAKWIDADEGEKLNAEFLAHSDSRVEAAEALVEQAFRDGLAYGTNVENADPDLAWQQSRARSSLNHGGKL